jgi:hypothetical protein
MTKQWEQYTDKIATFYLNALINDDYTGLTDYDVRDFDTWKDFIESQAHNDGWTVGHWTVKVDDNGDDWGKCSVSGDTSMRSTVILMVYKDVDE